MKRSVCGFLAVLLLTHGAWAIETGTIDSATTKEAAIEAYKTAAAARIATAKDTDKLPADEITRATNTVDAVANDATAGKLTTTDSTDKKNKKDKTDKSDKSDKSDKTDKTDKKDKSDTDDQSDKEHVPTDEEISELRDNYNAMKENEQSTANKLIGAAGIGATGAGGMQLAAGMAEKNADESAEQDMAAYLATFRCKYADGKMVRGGETDVVLPTSAELTTLYTEYMALAADLKLRKENLNMAPGIESEVILDSANIGLYDDESLGKNGGAFTSLSRALLDENSADAAAWAAQKAETEKTIKVGAGLAIGGAAISGIANLIANKDAPKERSAEILEKYKNKVQQPLEKLKQEIEEIVPTTVQCPTGATGTHPNCTCAGNFVYHATDNSCVACPGEKIAKDNVCVCPDAKPLAGDNDTCNAAAAPTIIPQCTVTDGSHLAVNAADGKCTCTDNFILSADGKSCSCPESTHTVVDGVCTQKLIVEAPVIAQIKIDASKGMFEHNSSKLTTKAQTVVSEFAQNLTRQIQEIQADAAKGAAAGTPAPVLEYCVSVIGYTDKTGSATVNNRISKQRAESVRNALAAANIPTASIKVDGKGESECTLGGEKVSAPECRKVEITVHPNSCPA